MFCPLHRRPLLEANDRKCEDCERLGLIVITCEIDKISRTIDTMNEQGYETDHFRSHVVLVFDRPPIQKYKIR